MTKILIIGAGRSSSSLIHYLLKHAASMQWHITVADANIQLAKEKVNGFTHCSTISLDITNNEERFQLISQHALVISMLPAFMHAPVAVDCVNLGRHLFTASYVSAEMKALHADAEKKGVLLMNEVGLDPGIDHASAMKIIHHLQQQGAEIDLFKSFCGGLVSPEFNNNPWGYKFSWNPRNVVLAGQNTAQYLYEGKLKFIPYQRLFLHTEEIEVDGHGKFEAYPNRDSLSYHQPYGLQNCKTLLRGTLRMLGYCKAWHALVKLGLTDDSFVIKNNGRLTYTDLLEAFLPPGNGHVKQRLKKWLGQEYDQVVEQKLDYLELFSNRKIELMEGTPAQFLQVLLEDKWKLMPGDQDMIVMQHIFEYRLRNASHRLSSSLIVKGNDDEHTAMAKTVGLPLAITVKNFLMQKFSLAGVQIPILPEIYLPMLLELEQEGICFHEKEF